MISLQILSKVLNTRDNTIIENNLLTKDYFQGYEKEYDFIQEHIQKYGNVPDKATFLAEFPDIELVEVTESDRYLLDTIREENLYYRAVPIIKEAASLLKSDSNAAAEYLIHSLATLQPNYDLGGTDIISDAKSRYDRFIELQSNPKSHFFTCGFQELDDIIKGIQRGEELFVIFARTNQGKSWVLEKMCTHIWQIGYNVGYVSPEMSADSIGYRFDTLNQHFSNKGLMWGNVSEVSNDDYASYINTLSNNEHRFIVSTPADFNKIITVSKLKNWVKQYKLDAIAIDGITYMSDERNRKGDNKTTSLTNISEDLMELSMELSIPVLVVVQANRTGVVEKGTDETPDLESIRDSDGIAHNASKILSIHQKENGILNMTIKKQRNGAVGGKLTYNWNINTGEFVFVPTFDDAEAQEVTEKKVKEVKRKYVDKTDAF